MPDDPTTPPPDAEELQPDPVPAPPPVLARRTDDRDRRRADRYDDDYDDDDRDAAYHPRGRNVKYDADGYEITQNAMMWAIFTHAGQFVVGVLAPLIILFAVKEPFVKRHARAALNLYLTVLLLTFVVLLLAAAFGYGTYMAVQDPLIGIVVFYGVYALLGLPLAVVNIVYVVIGIIAASKGQEYACRYAIRFLG